MDVLLIEPKTHGNVGFIARAMENFGGGKMHILNPRYDLSNDDINGFAMHGRDVLDHANIKENCTSILQQLEKVASKYQIVAATTGKRANYMKLYRVPISPRAAAEKLVGKQSLLVLGREDVGLTDEEIKFCDVTITIPANPVYPILNLSHAAAIILYEVWLLHGAIDEEMVFKLAPRDSRQAFHDWFHALMVDNFGTITDNWRVDNFLQSVSNIIERAGSTTRELDIIRGFLQTLINKMD